ncbi:MAG: ATP phosphoribosyltransferase [Planctomycetes bacterium]|nr:ATP phosphoribosyltransferase [Planctomycetota bacterium]
MNPVQNLPSGRELRTTASSSQVHLALPKGRMEAGVLRLLAEAGIHVRAEARGYRPRLSLEGFETKQLKPQNIVGMLAAGSRDLGFAGADWVAETGAELVELLDTGLDPVRIVVAAPASLLVGGALPARLADRPLVVASEYERLTRAWIAARAPDATFVRSFGATEVFPPEDADVVVDNTATGSTLHANGLVVVEEVMRSSTRLYANPRALDVADKRMAIDGLVLCLRAVLAARERAMVELNVGVADLERVVAVLPCMREPTVAGLHGAVGFAVRAAVPRRDLPRLVPLLKSRGATDIVVSACEQIVP